MKETGIELRKVTKQIKNKKIVTDLSFSIQRGEICGFLGPNGAGKTTTIRMMVGLMKLTAGDIFIAGYNIRTDYAKAIAQVGAVVESPEFYSFMSGRKNLLHFKRMSNKSIAEGRIEEVAHFVGLEYVLDKKVKTYSLGMRQRLGIAQALLHQPAVLILDEPMNGLDPAGICQLRDYLCRLAKKEQGTILISSHLLSEMELLCDRVLIIQQGKLIGEQVLHKDKKDASQAATTVCFTVNDSAQASAVLASSVKEVHIESASAVKVLLPHDDIPTAVATLVKHEVAIYEVRVVTPTLEETFLSLTEGGEIE